MHFLRRFLPINRQMSFIDTKKDLPKRTGPFTYYIRVIFTLQQLPVRQRDVLWARGRASKKRSSNQSWRRT